MPEEINRVLTDHLSTWLFCPTDTAVANLSAEGIAKGVLNVGDVMLDASLYYRVKARTAGSVLARLGLSRAGYVLATCHRAENTDAPERLESILRALDALASDVDVVLPLHPRTQAIIAAARLESLLGKVRLIEPVSFLDMISLEENARVIVTDSGGVQKEAYFFGVPCVTLRDETEWVETVNAGCNRLVGANFERIVDAVREARTGSVWPSFYGDGRAGQHILTHLAAGAA
jgi:UDP-GlcNAc3NAcA epimerase